MSWLYHNDVAIGLIDMNKQFVHGSGLKYLPNCEI